MCGAFIQFSLSCKEFFKPPTKRVSAKMKPATCDGDGVGPKNHRRLRRASCWATRDKFSAHTERGYLEL